MATISERLAYLLTADNAQFVKSFQQAGQTADKELGKADARLDKLGGNLTKVGAGAVAFAGIAGAGLVKLTMGASNLAESVNAVHVTFGDAADGMLKLGKDAATAVGLSSSEFNGLAVQFSSFVETVAGKGGDVVGTMDTLTTRVADFASVMNLDVPEAARIFQSALAGEQEAIKRYGVDMSAAAVETFALANGLIETKAELTETIKVQARYGLLMEATNKTAGDFANTSDGLANQQRILKAELKNLADGIGTGVLPMLTSVVTVAGKAIHAFAELSPEAQATAGRFAAMGVAGVGMLGTLSLVAGQAIKMRDRFTTLGEDGVRSLTNMGKAAKGLGIAMGIAAAALVVYSINAQQNAGSSAKAAEAMQEFSRVADEELGKTLLRVLSQAMFAGQSLDETMRNLARTNLEGAERLRENADAMGLATDIHDALNVAINTEIVARKQEEATTAAATTAEEDQTEAVVAATDAYGDLKKEMEGGISTADLALQSAEALTAQNEAAADAVAEHAEAQDAIADSYAEAADAALAWMDDVEGSMESAGGAISTFTDEALGDIDTFQAELATNTGSLHDWQDDIIAIAAATSPEFAGFLAEMGLAGSKLVDDLANNEGELATTFEQWKLAAAVAARDVPGEIAKADPETQRIIQRLGRNVIGTLDGQVAPTKTASLAVGQAIVDGMRAGVDGGARQVGAAAAAVVNKALADARAAGGISSPSQLFLDEVGTPIAEGIEEGIIEGADKIGKALERAIQSAEKDALGAVDDLVDAAKDRFGEAWGATDEQRDLERLNERISDAQTDVAEAQEKVNETAAEFGAGSVQHLKALESLSDAERSLRDAHFSLLKASEDLIGQGPASQAAFVLLAQAAGLEDLEIRRLILAYKELVVVRAEAAAVAAAIGAEADAAEGTRARFGNAAAAGLVPQEWIDHISQFTNDPRFVVELMNAFLGTLPNFAGGGIVPGVGPQLVVAHGGESIGTNGNGHGGAVINNYITAGMGADGREIGDVIVGKIREYERRNGNGWRG